MSGRGRGYPRKHMGQEWGYRGARRMGLFFFFVGGGVS